MELVDELRIEQVMTPAPTCLDARCTLGGALELLMRERYQSVPVVDINGRLTGVLTRAGVLEWLFARTQAGDESTLPELMAGPIPGPALASPVRCSPGMRVKEASRLLLREEAPALLVVRDDRLLGILTLQDVVRAVGYRDEPAGPTVGQAHGHCFTPDGRPEPHAEPEDDQAAQRALPCTSQHRHPRDLGPTGNLLRPPPSP